MLRASCHCGAIELELESVPETLTECSGSICRRYGTLWASYAGRSVPVLGDPGFRARYFWGDAGLDFVHCARCGRVMDCEPRGPAGAVSRIGINARMLDPALRAGIPIRNLEGADT